jgi:hypothetical protein
LGQHEGNEPGTGTNIEDTAGMSDVCPGSEEDSVRAYFHGTTIVTDGELLEGKIRIGHGFWA